MKRFGLLIASTLLSTPAFAGGYTLPIQSPRALSVGGALSASAQRGDAFWYNPSLLGDSGLDIGVSLVAMDATFTRAGGPQDGESVSNEAGPLPIPTIGAVWKASEMFSIGLGAYAPYGAQYKFAEDGPQRYALVENDKTRLLFVHLAASFRFGNLTVGGGVQNVIASVQQRMTFSGYTGLFGQPEDQDLDVLTELELHDSFTLTGNFGASYKIGPVTLGTAVQLPYTIGGEADFRVRLPSSVFFDNAQVEGDKVNVELPFPLAVRGGAKWQIIDDWSVEAMVNYEGWSVQNEIAVTPVTNITLTGVPAVGSYQLGNVSLPRNMQDTVSFHLGSDGRIYESLHLRGGFFYEPSSFTDETFSVAVLDGEKFGASLGASFDVGPVRIDIAAARIFQPTRTVQNSTLRQVNPTNPSQATVVGNGTYESGFWSAGLGASWAWDFGDDDESYTAAPASKSPTQATADPS